MSIEKRTDPFYRKDSLKDRLDRLAILPEQEPLDKGRAWEKLDERLGRQPRRRRTKYPMYWIAAACLLGVFVMAGVRMGSTAHRATGKNTGVTTPDTVLVKRSTGYPEPRIAGPVTENYDRKYPATRLHPEITVASHRRIARPGGGKPEIANPGRDTGEIVISLPPALPVSAGSLPSAAPTRIRRGSVVVHLNEAGLSPDDNASLEQRPAQPSFRIKLYNPANLSVPALAEEAPVTPVIKIKRSSQN